MTRNPESLATWGFADADADADSDAWRVELSTAFQDLVPEQLDDHHAPRGRMAGVHLGPAAMFCVSGTPQVVRRNSRAVRSAPGDLIKACVQLGGRATVQQGDHEVVLRPGQLAVYDTARPYAIRLDGRWTCGVMAVPRAALALPDSMLDSALHRVRASAHGPGLVLSEFIATTVAQISHAGAATAARLGEAGASLLAGTLADAGDRAAVDTTETLRSHVMSYVRAHLADPALSRASVAAAHHVSVRTLDRLFADEPWSISGYIRHERLAAVRRDLEDPALTSRSVATLAARWCFFDAAHFSRVFRARYGYPPSQARTVAPMAAPAVSRTAALA